MNQLFDVSLTLQTKERALSTCRVRFNNESILLWTLLYGENFAVAVLNSLCLVRSMVPAIGQTCRRKSVELAARLIDVGIALYRHASIRYTAS